MDFNDEQNSAPLPLEQLLPIRCLSVALQFTGPSRPKFFHQASLAAFIRQLLRDPDDFDTLIRLEIQETGQTDFDMGDRYTFRVFGLAGSDDYLSTLIDSLKALPESALRRDHRICFRDNLRLIELRDGITDTRIDAIEQLEAYGDDALEADIDAWTADDTEHLDIYFSSPVRLFKDKKQRADLRGEARYCRDHKDLDGELLINRVRDSFADLLRRRGAKNLPPRASAPTIETSGHDLFWLDSIYSDPNNSRDGGMGGMSGKLHLSTPQGLSRDWLKLLALGQFTGIGQRTSQGWGRFQLQNTAGNPCGWLGKRTTGGSTKHILGEKNILTAYYHCLFEREKLESMGSYSQTDDSAKQDSDSPVSTLRQTFEQLIAAGSTPIESHEFSLANAEQTVSTMPFVHRVLQQAIVQVLLPRLLILQRPNAKHDQLEIQQSLQSLSLHVRLSEAPHFAQASKLAKGSNAQQIRHRLITLFGEDPIFNYVESALDSSPETLNIASPLAALVGPAIGMHPLTNVWPAVEKKKRSHVGAKRPTVRVKSRARSASQ